MQDGHHQISNIQGPNRSMYYVQLRCCIYIYIYISKSIIYTQPVYAHIQLHVNKVDVYINVYTVTDPYVAIIIDTHNEYMNIYIYTHKFILQHINILHIYIYICIICTCTVYLKHV